MTMTTPTNGFLTEAPLQKARRLAAADLRNQIGAADLRWLHAYPLLWLRALTRIRLDVQGHIAKSRTGIAHLKPAPGEPQTEYLVAKRQIDEATTARLHFAQKVDNRVENVKSILGPDQALGRITAGDVVATMEDIAELIRRGSFGDAREKALWHAVRWARGGQAGD